MAHKSPEHSGLFLWNWFWDFTLVYLLEMYRGVVITPARRRIVIKKINFSNIFIVLFILAVQLG